MTATSVRGKAADHAVARLIGVRDVLELTSGSRGTLYLWINDGKFPKPFQLGKRRVAWREQEVRSWVESRSPVAWAA